MMRSNQRFLCQSSFQHTAVLTQEILSYLPDDPSAIIDFTLGGGNHSKAILEARPNAFLYGVDRDEEAIEAASLQLTNFHSRTKFIHNSFSSALQYFQSKPIKADFILADLGVSSHQLTSGERGFSFRSEGPLDMRMDRQSGLTAAQIINQFSEQQLAQIISKYGEERFANRIAQKIVAQRDQKEILGTRELSQCITDAIPKKFQGKKTHPSTKTFQALRIYINEELQELNLLLEGVIDLLNSDGIVAIISFHSLEDRQVKRRFRELEFPCKCPKHLPVCICGKKAVGKSLHKKAIRPNEEECSRNPRSRSAKLRIFKKI